MHKLAAFFMFSLLMPLMITRVSASTCEVSSITIKDALSQSQRFPGRGECQDALPELACGWQWIRVYKIDLYDSEQWEWQSWPDGVNLIIENDQLLILLKSSKFQP